MCMFIFLKLRFLRSTPTNIIKPNVIKLYRYFGHCVAIYKFGARFQI